MVGIALEHFGGQRASLHVVAERRVVERSAGAQQRERIESLDFVVVGELFVEALHGVHVGDTAFAPVTVAPQRLDRDEEALLSFGWRLGQAGRRRRSEPRQHRARVFPILLGLERMVVGERLAPVGEGKIGLRRLGELELRDGLLPPEAVEDGNAAQEMLLRRRATQRSGTKGAHIVELRRRGRDESGAMTRAKHSERRRITTSWEIEASTPN